MQRGKASVSEVPVRFCESSKRRDSAANFVDDKVWEIGKGFGLRWKRTVGLPWR